MISFSESDTVGKCFLALAGIGFAVLIGVAIFGFL